MDTQSIDTQIANVNSFYQNERRQKEKLLGEIQVTKEILKEYIERTCTRYEMPFPEIRIENPLSEIVGLAIDTFQAVMADAQTPQGSNDSEIVQRLRDEKKLLEEKLLKCSNAEVPPDSLTTPLPDQEQNTTAKRADEIITLDLLLADENNKPLNPLINIDMLKLAGQSHKFNVEDLIVECETQLDLSVKDAGGQIELLKSEGLLELITTKARPIPGSPYPILFRLTKSGMSASGSKHQPEAEVLLRGIDGMTENELPIFVFAVEEFLPKHGYTFVKYLSSHEYKDDNNKAQTFVAHAQLTDPDGNNIFVLYQGDGYNDGYYLQKHLKQYSIVSGRRAYIICLTPRTADLVTGKINYLTLNNKMFDQVYITNVSDWIAYDKMVKSGDTHTPATVWFGKLFSKG